MNATFIRDKNDTEIPKKSVKISQSYIKVEYRLSRFHGPRNIGLYLL